MIISHSSYPHLQEMQYADECTALRGKGHRLWPGGVETAAGLGR